MSFMQNPQPAVIELKDADDPAALVTKAIGDLQTSVNDRLAAIEAKAGDPAKLTDRLDKIEAKVNRVNIGGVATEERAPEQKAFGAYARGGEQRMSADEMKTMTVNVGSGGGFIVPPEFAKELLKKLRDFSPIRQYAKAVTVGAAQVTYPRRVSSTAATWTGEIDDRTSSEMAFEQVTLTPYELATFTDVSNQLLEDNAYNLEGELAADLAESFAIAEGVAFVSGNGTGKPKGIMAASGLASVKTGVAADFPASNPADVLIGMYHKLPGIHAQNGVWMMNRTTLGKVRTWKDGQGRYLVIDPISEGAATTLLGRPIVEAVDMDDIGASKFPILFGDLQGYRIVDRIDLSLLRDPYTLAGKGQVRFHARKRVGADVTHPDRFVKLQCAV